MARVTEKGLIGRIGPVVYYEMNGKQYARARPMHKKKRTRAANNQAASIFGVCSGAASTAGHTLRAVLDFSFKLKSFNMLRGWLFKEYRLNHERTDWYLGQDFTPACQLNPQADLRDYLFVPVAIKSSEKGKLHLHIPAFNPVRQILHPALATSVVIRVLVMGLALRNEKQEPFFIEQKLTVNISDPTFPSSDLHFEHEQMKPNAVATVMVALSYYTNNKELIRDEKYLPAAIMSIGRVAVSGSEK